MALVKSLLARLLRLRGWKFIGEIPDDPRVVIVGAPHTSNLDFLLFLAALHEFGVDVSYLGKHSLFRWPMGHWMRRWGGIPVNRDAPGGVVRQAAETMRQAERVVLVVAPEGTRSKTRSWKDGFIRIAEAADALVVLVGIDAPTRRVIVGPSIAHPGRRKDVMKTARAFYEPLTGINPARQGPVRLEDEAP